jgi:hypothetical protein
MFYDTINNINKYNHVICMKKDKYFNPCCEKCQGKCCKVGGLYITNKEFQKVPNEFKKYFKKHFSGYHTPLGHPCPFITNSGCSLNENRFLECKLYPLEVRSMSKLILKKECPFKKCYNTTEFLEISLNLLKKYIDDGLFDEDDVVSILNNSFPDKL